jgi:hypothetical protein
MRLNAAAARWRLGQLVGGLEGLELVLAANRWMSGQQIRVPARMAATYAPGFTETHTLSTSPHASSETITPTPTPTPPIPS